MEIFGNTDFPHIVRKASQEQSRLRSYDLYWHNSDLPISRVDKTTNLAHEPYSVDRTQGSRIPFRSSLGDKVAVPLSSGLT